MSAAFTQINANNFLLLVGLVKPDKMVSKKDYDKNLLLIGLLAACWLFFFCTLKAFSLESKSLPALQSHPVPSLLAQWKDVNQQGDYFELIEKTAVDYLIWSQLPVKVYVEPLDLQDNSAKEVRLQQWISAVRNAITEWNVYLPLQEVNELELADIVIVRSSVERKIQLNSDTGLYDIPQAITAQTNYQFYLTQEQILAHKMTIKISPDLGQPATEAAARHELGHGLGIWGHSDQQSDALYFSQVQNTPTISARDVNTLKKIYQQPTRLGWQVLQTNK